MWYKYSEEKAQTKENENNPDYQLIISIIENMARHRLFLQTKYNPTPVQIKSVVKRVVTKLEEQYGKLSVMRNKANAESLTPIIQSTVDEVFTKKK